MFVGPFQNRLRAAHFNESLTQRLAKSLAEVLTRVECYIKGEESNILVQLLKDDEINQRIINFILLLL